MTRVHMRLLICAAAAVLIGQPARAQQEFHVGMVASLTGPFASPSKDTIDGFNAWIKHAEFPARK